MDDIYGDLDNFNDQNIIAELRNENKELKCKLDEYATTMDTLRKDFDKLSAEYKKLELNYSSLLKTAKAEIDRKTKIIVDLNKEKDRLIINSTQNWGRRPPNIPHVKYDQGSAKHVGQNLPKENNSNKEKHETSSQKSAESTKATQPLSQRKNTQHGTPSSTSLSSDTGRQEKEPKITDNQNNNLKKNGGKEDKTEVSQNKKQEPISNVKRIMNRRKSMPALQRPNVIYSSEEEEESNNLRDNRVKKKTDEDVDRKRTHDKHESFNSRTWNRNNTDHTHGRSNSRDAWGKKNTDGNLESNYTRDSWSRKNTDQKSDPSNVRGDHCRRNSDQKNESNNSKDDWGRQNRDSFRDYQGRKTVEEKFIPTSDERCSRKSQERNDSNFSRFSRGRKKTPFRDADVERNYYNRDRRDCDRNTSKAPNMSGIDNRHLSYHDSRDMCNQNQFSRYHGNDRYCDQDKSEFGLRAKRANDHFSPGRNSNMQPNRFSGDNGPRSEYVPHPVVKGPGNSYIETRRNLGGEHQRFNEQEIQSMKHKLQTEVEEPPYKRIRTNSQNRQVNEIGIIHHNQDVQTQTGPVIGPPHQFDDFSCQSPDYEYNPSLYPVKEIMYTASTKLEDPRLKSKKYILRNENNREVLSTVIDTNVDLKYIKKFLDIPKEKVPSPLKVKPQNVSEEFVKELYREIHYPTSHVLSLCLEPGEITWSDDETTPANAKPIEEEPCPIKSDVDIQQQERSVTNTKPVPKLDSTSQYPETLPKCSAVPSKYHEFPKIKKPDKHNTEVCSESTHQRETHIAMQPPKVDKKKYVPLHSEYHKSNKKNIDDQKTSVKIISHNKLYIDPNTLSCGNEIIKKDKKENKPGPARHDTHTTHLIVKLPLLPKDIVEGDLELSDETSDCMDIADQPKDVVNKKGLDKDKEKHTDNLDLIMKTIMGDKVKQSNIQFQNSNNSSHNQDGVSGEELKFNNKLKEYPGSSQEIQYNQEEKRKSMTEREDIEPKLGDVKNTFCDLFGDSSSLITPDDLGITNKNQVLEEYIPLCEDTQGAVDLDLNLITNIQTCSSANKNNETKIKNEPKHGKHDKKHKIKDTTGSSIETKKKSKRPSTEGLLENTGKRISPEKQNVVKTVIISSGVQNKVSSDSCKKTKDATPVAQNKDTRTSQTRSRMKALATSTPHKAPELDKNQKSNSILSPQKGAKEPSSSTSNTDDTSKKEAITSDVPDVRIFVKRRRKTKASTSHN